MDYLATIKKAEAIGFSLDFVQNRLPKIGAAAAEFAVQAVEEHGVSAAEVESLATQVEPDVIASLKDAFEQLQALLDGNKAVQEVRLHLHLDQLDPKTFGFFASILVKKFGPSALTMLADAIDAFPAAEGSVELAKHALAFAVRHYGEHLLESLLADSGSK